MCVSQRLGLGLIDGKAATAGRTILFWVYKMLISRRKLVKKEKESHKRETIDVGKTALSMDKVLEVEEKTIINI